VIAREGDVVFVAMAHEPTTAELNAIKDQVGGLLAASGVKVVFLPPGSKSPEPEGMSELVAEVRKLREEVARLKPFHGYTGPR
jgi:hypothetical protein